MTLKKALVNGSGKPQQLQSGDYLDISKSSGLLSTMDARLTTVLGDPTGSASDVSTIYYTPFRGDKICLYDGTNWNLHTLTEISVAVPSTLFRVFNIYVYNNAGTLALETLDWSQTTGAISGATNATPVVLTLSSGHGLSSGDLVGIAGMGGLTSLNGKIWQLASVGATSATVVGSAGNGTYTSGGTWYKVSGLTPATMLTQDGIPVKSSDATRRYVGVGMTTGVSGQTTVSISRCWLVNLYNQIDHVMTYFDATSHTYASTTVRPWNNSGEAHVDFLVPFSQPTTEIGHCSPLISGSATTTQPSVGAGTNTLAALNRYVAATGGTNSERYSAVGFTEFTQSYNFVGINEQNQGAGTGTYTQVVFQLHIKR